MRVPTVRSRLPWIPAARSRRVNTAVSPEPGDDDPVDGLRYRERHSKTTWSFIMPFDLEHYIEDHSCNGEHKRY